MPGWTCVWMLDAGSGHLCCSLRLALTMGQSFWVTWHLSVSSSLGRCAEMAAGTARAGRGAGQGLSLLRVPGFTRRGWFMQGARS